MRFHRSCVVAAFLALCLVDVIFAAESHSSFNSGRAVYGEHISSVEMVKPKSLSTPLPVELILAISSFLMNISVTPSMVASERRAVWILCKCAFVYNNFPVSVFPGKLSLHECLCFWQVAPDIVPHLQHNNIKLPKYCTLLGDIGHGLALLQTDYNAHTVALTSRLCDLSVPFAERIQSLSRYFGNIQVEQLARGPENWSMIIFSLTNVLQFGETVYQLAMARHESSGGYLLGRLMSFSVPIGYFSKLATVLEQDWVIIGFFAAPAISYSDTERQIIYDRNKNLIDTYFGHNAKVFVHMINSIRFADLAMVSSVEVSSRMHELRAHYYALIYSCHWDRPELFAAWSKLFSAMPWISKLEHELIFEKQSLSGYENSVDNPIIFGILKSFNFSINTIVRCQSEAFLSLWYSIMRINAINSREGETYIHWLYPLTFSFAKTAEDKELFAAMIVRTFPGKHVDELPYDPILIKQALSYPEIGREYIIAYFAYSVVHNIPELMELIFQKYGKTAAERRRLCRQALRHGLIPPAFRNALPEDLSISHYLGDLLSSIVPSSTEQACVIS